MHTCLDFLRRIGPGRKEYSAANLIPSMGAMATLESRRFDVSGRLSFSGAPPLSWTEQDRCDPGKLNLPLLVAKMGREENMVAVQVESNLAYF